MLNDMAKAKQFASIEGVGRCIAKLQEIDKKMGNKILKTAFRLGAKPVQKAVKALVPVDEGTLKRSIKVRALPRKKGRVGINITTAKENEKGFIAAFQDLGTKNEDGSVRIEPKQFMEKGFDQTKKQAKDIIVDEIKKGLDEIVKKK
jgi:HK97 gp10 family phage protein